MTALITKAELSVACGQALRCPTLDDKTKLLVAELVLHIERSVTLTPAIKQH